ncbi:MAG: hypothetical protein ACYCVN_04160 [Acidimicrobiales bacterium]
MTAARWNGAGSSGAMLETRSRRWIPIWLLQVVELAAALTFVDVSLQVARSGLLVGAALALLIVALTADGPIGLVRICRPRLHIVLVSALGAVVALSPIVPVLRPDLEGIIVAVLGGVGLLRLATLTRTETTRGARSKAASRSRSAAGPIIDTTASVSGPHGSKIEGSSRPESTAAGETARRVGQATGAAVASGKRAADRLTPVAGAHVRRSLRRAGRTVAAWRKPPPDRGG